MEVLSHDACIALLSAGSRTGKLATTRADGRPHVAPIWFVVSEERDALVFMTGEDTLKARNLRRDPRCMLSVDEEVFPYAFVLVEGAAELSRPSPDALLPWSLRIAERYVPAERVEATGRRNAVEGELLVRVPFAKLIGRGGVAS